MAFRRVRRRHVEARKSHGVRPIIEELLQAIEGNGMTIRSWFEAMDQLSLDNRVTMPELAKGMRMLEMHGKNTKKQRVFTTQKVGGRGGISHKSGSGWPS